MLYTEKLLITAGGKISCHRCQALSKRTKQHIKSGLYTKESRLRESSTSLTLAQLEDMMHVLNMTTAHRTRGPKPLNYKRLTSLDDVRDAIVSTAILG